jgi:hypothetical protein
MLGICKFVGSVALVAAVMLGGIVGCDAQDQIGVRIGATVAEVEAVMGPAISVLPNFGREQRFYKAKSGEKYMITFEDGKVVEIH